MKNFVILVATSLFLFSCDGITGNGNVKEEKRNLSEIQSIKTSGSIDVLIVSGDTYSLLVTDDENVLPYIVTEVNNGELNIHYKNGTSIMNDHAKVTVTVPSISRISTSGSADITTEGVLKNSDGIEWNTSGSGDIKATIDAPSIKVKGSGSGDISLSGTTKNFDCQVSGSGDINCGNLKSENAVIKISGSSDAHVFASVSLKATVSGSGNIYYAGHPSSPEIHISGSGTVKATD